MRKSVFMLLFAIVSLLAASSCREKTTGEKIKDGVEEVGDDIKDGAEKVGDDIKEGVDEVGDEIDDATDDNN